VLADSVSPMSPADLARVGGLIRDCHDVLAEFRLRGARLRAVADGYGLDEPQRRALPALIGAHARGMFDLLRGAALTGEQPWARLYAEGHADHWGPAADYIERNEPDWSSALLSDRRSIGWPSDGNGSDVKSNGAT
jgi:hypothetical protein